MFGMLSAQWVVTNLSTLVGVFGCIDMADY